MSSQHFCATAVVTLAGAALTTPASAQDRVAEPFVGVRHIQQVVNVPRPLFVNVLEIDLSAPGLSFRLTPQVEGLANGDETVTQTTRAFVEQENAQLGINAHFFRLEHHSQQRPTNNISLAASDGDAYSPWQGGLNYGFNIGPDNVATYIEPGASGGTSTDPNVQLYNAFAGNFQIVADGQAATQGDIPRDPGTGHMRDVHPRTAVGLTADNKLLLVTVDGRQSVFSEGVYLDELGSLMQRLGATQAVNLDGGGSTTMVTDYFGDTVSGGGDQGALLLNSPVGRGAVGSERNNGTNLAIFAEANPAYTLRIAPAVPAGVSILADFEQDEGAFASGPISGSNRNIDRATIERIANDGYLGESAQRLAIDAGDAATPTPAPMALRNLSGGGEPANNAAFASEGHVGYFVKIVTPGLSDGDVLVSLNLDDSDGNEQGVLRSVPTDGEWHLVEWDLDSADDWNTFAGGNGVIDAESVTLDAMYLASPTNRDVIVYWDVLAHNPDGSLTALVPEPHAAVGVGAAGLLALRRSR